MFAASKTASSGSALDPQFNYVTMLLHGDGTNGAQNNTFLDSSTNNFTITRNGNTTQGSFSPYGSNWSNYFDGTGDYLSYPNSSAFAFGTGSFTIEGWVNSNSLSDSFILSGRAAIGALHITYGGFGGSTAGSLRYVGSSTITSGTTLISNGLWNHFAIVRNGSSNITLYINGVSVGTGTDSNNYSATTGTWYINANDSGPTAGGAGYISNLRIVKGTAVYTSNFTPSATPLTAITNTSLLTCQSNRFIDNSASSVTFTKEGDTSVQRFNPFGASTAYSTSVIGGSGYFDGNGDYLVTSGTGSFNPRSTFTVEFWTYPISNNTVTWINSNTNNSFYFETSGTTLFVGDGIINTIGTSAPTVNQWTHMLLSFDGTTYRLFYNGVLQASSTSLLQSNVITAFRIGQKQEGTRPFNGYITDMRVLVGTALYTSAFTPPTAPITAITNTSLLLNYTNGAIFDNAMINDLETVGNAQISTSVKKFGTGSMYFDGTGDYLSTPSAPTNQMGIGNFTIEAWIYPTTISGTHTIVGKYVGGSVANSEYWLFVTSTGKLAFAIDGSAGETYTESSAGAIVANTWTYVAAIRTASAIGIYVNGTQVNAAGVSAYALSTNTTPLNIGAYNNGLGLFVGYIDDLRITKGVARTITLPTAAFPNTGPI